MYRGVRVQAVNSDDYGQLVDLLGVPNPSSTKCICCGDTIVSPPSPAQVTDNDDEPTLKGFDVVLHEDCRRDFDYLKSQIGLFLVRKLDAIEGGEAQWPTFMSPAPVAGLMVMGSKGTNFLNGFGEVDFAPDNDFF
jgi:hypothetical protein